MKANDLIAKERERCARLAETVTVNEVAEFGESVFSPDGKILIDSMAMIKAIAKRIRETEN